MLTSTKRNSRLFFILQSVRSREGMSPLIPPPFELRSSLKGFEKPISENWAVGNESSSLVSDSSSMSTYLVI